jgi:putative PIN family toxin of toxin-antitoxin system
MIRVVLDTNIVVSASLNEDGSPFYILKLALTGVIRMYVSEPILAEYEELLKRSRFQLDRRRVSRLLGRIRAAATLVATAGGLSAATDPDDDIFLECAYAAKAQYLITGNTAHFPKRWKYTSVLTPRAFFLVWKGLRGDAQDS